MSARKAAWEICDTQRQQMTVGKPPKNGTWCVTPAQSLTHSLCLTLFLSLSLSLPSPLISFPHPACRDTVVLIYVNVFFWSVGKWRWHAVWFWCAKFRAGWPPGGAVVQHGEFLRPDRTNLSNRRAYDIFHLSWQLCTANTQWLPLPKWGRSLNCHAWHAVYRLPFTVIKKLHTYGKRKEKMKSERKINSKVSHAAELSLMREGRRAGARVWAIWGMLWRLTRHKFIVAFDSSDTLRRTESSVCFPLRIDGHFLQLGAYSTDLATRLGPSGHLLSWELFSTYFSLSFFLCFCYFLHAFPLLSSSIESSGIFIQNFSSLENFTANSFRSDRRQTSLQLDAHKSAPPFYRPSVLSLSLSVSLFSDHHRLCFGRNTFGLFVLMMILWSLLLILRDVCRTWISFAAHINNNFWHMADVGVCVCWSVGWCVLRTLSSHIAADSLSIFIML